MIFNDTFSNISVWVRIMMFNDTFNNISVCFRGLGLWCLMTYNISVCFRGLGLWCLRTRSTLFQFVLEG